MYSDSLPLSSKAVTAAQKTPGTYREELNHLASGQELEGGAAFCQKKSAGKAIVPLMGPLSTKLAGRHHT